MTLREALLAIHFSNLVEVKALSELGTVHYGGVTRERFTDKLNKYDIDPSEIEVKCIDASNSTIILTVLYNQLDSEKWLGVYFDEALDD